MASAYNKTPYDLLQDTPLAFNFNRAVYTYGARVEQLLEEREEVKSGKDKGKLKRKYTLDEALELAAKPIGATSENKGLAMVLAMFSSPDVSVVTG